MKLGPYANEIIGDHQSVFEDRLTTDQVFIRQILEKKWEFDRYINSTLILKKRII